MIVLEPVLRNHDYAIQGGPSIKTFQVSLKIVLRVPSIKTFQVN